MDDLVRFLRARYDEEAALAQTAADYDDGAGHDVQGPPGTWTLLPDEDSFGAGHPGGMIGPRIGYTNNVVLGEHIVVHDPARVLREVEAKRRRLARHVPERRRLTLLDENGGATSFGFYVCTACTPNRTIEHGQEVVEWPCHDVRDDALPYADHRDYLEAWRPPGVASSSRPAAPSRPAPTPVTDPDALPVAPGCEHWRREHRADLCPHPTCERCRYLKAL